MLNYIISRLTDQFWFHVFSEVCSAEPPVPVISDVTAVHDITKEITKVSPWNLERAKKKISTIIL